MYPIPARHGMTVGELATLFNDAYGIGADLIVIRARSWQRAQWMDDTGLPWVNPSPNLRSLAALTSYPGTVYFEGTTLTEGAAPTVRSSRSARRGSTPRRWRAR